MSIPRPEATVPSSESFDCANTELIRHLANSLFTEGSGRSSGVPQFPQTAGVPTRASAAPELSGGFPSTSPTATPVHPAHDLSEPEHSPQPSGGHDPASTESYPFGEPRCTRTVGNTKVCDQPAEPPALAAASSEFLPPHYYFLPDTSSRHDPLIPKGFDLEGVRRDFPALHQRVNGHPLIWLDNAATTQKPKSVIEATSEFYSRDNSNIHRAAHVLAERSTQHFESSREKVRQFLGAADKKEIVFLRGTTEAINLVAQSYGRKHIGAGDEIILTTLEHHANIVPWQLLAEQVQAKIRVVPINDRGELRLDKLAELFNAKTKFLSVTHVSNALGTINPVEEIIQMAHAYGVPVLVDGAQSTPHLPVNVQAMDADFFVFSGHKIFGPTGIGALYGKAALLEEMPPWQGGGHMIRDVSFEKTVYQNAPEKFEAGTPDIAGVVGLGAAIDYLFQTGIPAIAAYEHALLEYATAALSTIPKLRPIGTATNKASVLSFVIPGVSNDVIANHLDKHGIAVRAGHHCALPAQRHFGVETTVRPSLAFYNTRSEVDTLVEVLHRLPRR